MSKSCNFRGAGGRVLFSSDMSFPLGPSSSSATRPTAAFDSDGEVDGKQERQKQSRSLVSPWVLPHLGSRRGVWGSFGEIQVDVHDLLHSILWCLQLRQSSRPRGDTTGTQGFRANIPFVREETGSSLLRRLVGWGADTLVNFCQSIRQQRFFCVVPELSV